MDRKGLLSDTHELRKIAVEAVVDDRTVARYLRGEPVLNSSRVRIEAALRELGLITRVRRIERLGSAKQAGEQ